MESKMRTILAVHAPRDILSLPTDPLAPSMYLPYNPAQPFHPGWDDGCFHSNPLVFVTKYLANVCRDYDIEISPAFCRCFWHLFEQTRKHIAVCKQNSHRVLFVCLILCLKWLEDELDESMDTFLRLLPFELYHRLHKASMAASMEWHLFAQIFKCNPPFLYK